VPVEVPIAQWPLPLTNRRFVAFDQAPLAQVAQFRHSALAVAVSRSQSWLDILLSSPDRPQVYPCIHPSDADAHVARHGGPDNSRISCTNLHPVRSLTCSSFSCVSLSAIESSCLALLFLFIALRELGDMYQEEPQSCVYLIDAYRLIV
jgi:hypothetical protein